LMQTFEAPTIQLAREGLVFALHEVFGHSVSNQKILFVNFPRPSVWLWNERDETSKTKMRQ
jgi:hypothetical protein